MIPVYDCRTDLDENVVVRPELRGRFLRLEPLPPPPQHSHDLAGEVFLVLEGRCEFLVGDERATCGPGQLIYVDKTVRHSMHAVGTEPCVLYLSVTPHVEPTHTFYDEHGRPAAIRYDAWQGRRHPDGSADAGRPAPDPDFGDGTLTGRYLRELRALSELARSAAEAASAHAVALNAAVADEQAQPAKAVVDEMWTSLKRVLTQVEAAELAWNALAPQVMPSP
jgi:quercetin dioxygenase-like cupin family protein